jgi:hypothetical protein
MTWLREAINDDKTGLASSTRIAVLSATWTLCITTLSLTVAVWVKPELASVLTVCVSALATMAGGSYIMKQYAGKTND